MWHPPELILINWYSKKSFESFRILGSSHFILILGSSCFFPSKFTRIHTFPATHYAAASWMLLQVFDRCQKYWILSKAFYYKSFFLLVLTRKFFITLCFAKWNKLNAWTYFLLSKSIPSNNYSQRVIIEMRTPMKSKNNTKLLEGSYIQFVTGQLCLSLRDTNNKPQRK